MTPKITARCDHCNQAQAIYFGLLAFLGQLLSGFTRSGLGFTKLVAASNGLEQPTDFINSSRHDDVKTRKLFWLIAIDLYLICTGFHHKVVAMVDPKCHLHSPPQCLRAEVFGVF
jgi:hypothetical protein